jgi:hypothetical protein
MDVAPIIFLSFLLSGKVADNHKYLIVRIITRRQKQPKYDLHNPDSYREN